jgi:hypothetical protein
MQYRRVSCGARPIACAVYIEGAIKQGLFVRACRGFGNDGSAVLSKQLKIRKILLKFE